MADISKIQLPDNTQFNIKDPVARASIGYGVVDGTSTSTAFTATISGVTEYYDGLAIMLKNGVVDSASNFTININNLGAKPCYNNTTNTTQDTTFKVDYIMLFVYDSTRVTNGGWICYYGYTPVISTATINSILNGTYPN